MSVIDYCGKVENAGSNNIDIKKIDLKTIDPISRILLSTNGTLTKILEAIFMEKIVIEKLLNDSPVESDVDLICEIKKNESLSVRKVLLKGEETNRNYVFAKTLIINDRLNNFFYRELRETNTPIGLLWEKYRIELYKEFCPFQVVSAGKLAPYFNINSSDKIYSRTYLVYANGQPITQITEKFSNFRSDKI